MGTALSPNGLGMAAEGMVSLSQLDRVLEVDAQRRTITVEAGARVSQVLAALAEHGLTLQNFSSIQEQQMGGWTQVRREAKGSLDPPRPLQSRSHAFPPSRWRRTARAPRSPRWRRWSCA